MSSWTRSLRRFIHSAPSPRRVRRVLQLEALEDRCVPTINVTGLNLPTGGAAIPFEGQALTNLAVATFSDTNNAITSGQFTVTINYGDGTTPVTNASVPPVGTIFDPNLMVAGSAGQFSIADNHTFPEESGSVVPPGAFTVSVTVKENLLNGSSGSGTGSAMVLDAPIVPGNPITLPLPAGSTQLFTGIGGNNTSTTIGTANDALHQFELGIGGVKNTAAAPQNGGFRVINWDAVKVDGTDAAAGAGSTTVIPTGNHTVGIPLNRFEGQGVFFGAVYGVSNDGFVDVNPAAAGLFTPFSPLNTFAMFNDNGIDFKFVVPNSPFTAPVVAATRGFGSIFLNVTQPGTTIEYFHGDALLDTLNVPVGGQGTAVFAAELFNSPIVTNVVLTLGTGVLFHFNGTSVTSGGADTALNNLVVTDDFVFPEPVPVANGFPIVSGSAGFANAVVTVNATQGASFSAPVASFFDTNPNGTSRDFTAIINWGDGKASVGTLISNSNGGFDVTGTHTYGQAGSFTISTDVQDFGGGPGLGGSLPTLSITNQALVAGVTNIDQLYVSQVYLDLLHRPADPLGLGFWAGMLGEGRISRQAVVMGLQNSGEYRALEVNEVFQHYLHRAADAPAVGPAANFLIAGGSLEQFIDMVVSSPEYFQLRGGNTNQGWLAALWQDSLGRPIDTQASTAALQALANGALLRQVAQTVLSSGEYQMHIVDVFYQDFLRRHADASGSGFLTGLFAQGTVGGFDPDSRIISALLGSEEYFASVQARFPLATITADPLQSSIP